MARSLLASLDGTPTAHELELEFGAELARDTLAQLSELGLLDRCCRRCTGGSRARPLATTASSATSSERLERAVPPFGVPGRLRDARVLILG